jgi:hypothetical protein
MRVQLRVRSGVVAALTTTLALGLCSLLVAGCGNSDSPSVSASPASKLSDLEGLYRVSGKTAQVDGSDERRISGTVRLVHESDSYTSTYELKTTFPGRDDELVADVIGTGVGRFESETLVGTAETQLVVSTVPGVDPGFAFVPRVVGLRISSVTRANFLADGSVTMQVENSPGEGEQYTPTHTLLEGQRIDE